MKLKVRMTEMRLRVTLRTSVGNFRWLARLIRVNEVLFFTNLGVLGAWPYSITTKIQAISFLLWCTSKETWRLRTAMYYHRETISYQTCESFADRSSILIRHLPRRSPWGGASVTRRRILQKLAKTSNSTSQECIEELNRQRFRPLNLLVGRL